MQHPAAKPKDFAGGVHRDRHVPILIALLGRAEEMLAAVLDPLHRPAKLERHRRNHRLLRIEDRLRPKTAADVRRDHADRFDIAVEQIGEHAAAEMRRLRAGPYREQVRNRIVARQHGAGLDRHAAAAMLPEHLLEDVRGAGEGGLDVAISEREAGNDVAGEIAVRARRIVLDGGAAVGGGGEHVVIDDDRRGGILGKIPRVGDYHGDRLADITGFVARQRRLRARRGDGGIRREHRDRHPAHRLGQIVGGEHRMDARHRHGGADVDAADHCMSMRRAHEAGMQQAGQFQIVDEAAAAGEQRRVLQPLHPRAEMFCAHRSAHFPAPVAGEGREGRSPRSRCAASSAALTMPA